MVNLEQCAIIIRQICDATEPGKKMVQKLFYLMERKGLQLNLAYSIHFFGPYSAKLDTALHTLESMGSIEIDTSGMTHIIREGKNMTSAALNATDSSVVNYVLDNFLGKTALELEALTTLDYAATTILKGKCSDEDIINEVVKIKGKKFPREYLSRELVTLKQTGYIQ